MSHNTGTVRTQSPVTVIGPATGPPTDPPDTWSHAFAHTPAPGGTKLLMLHFRNVSLPGNCRLEVDLGYGTDVFTAAAGPQFWTRPINVYVLPGGLVPIRYVRNGPATGSVELDQYGRGESLPGNPGHPSLSNCDPFLEGASYVEPTYDPWWYCVGPPSWENVACVPSVADVRARVARSVGMIVSVEAGGLSTCSVTLVDADKVITAGHCHTPSEALTSSITFDYQTACGGGKPPGYNPRFYKVQAVLEHAYVYGVRDYSLLQLAEAPPGVPAIQLRHDVPDIDEQVFGVHHPNGAVKKLSIPHPGFDTVLANGSPWVSVHSNFHVSGGSSGSGLFDTAGRIIGVLSSGDPCGNAGAPFPLRYYSMASFLQETVPAPPPPVTRDVMVVFDRSGSMSQDDGTGRKKIESARDAVSLFVQLVLSGVGNRVGLVSFSTTASSPVDFGIAAVTEPNKVTLIGPAPYSAGKVGALGPGGSTSIGEGLDAARLQFPVPGSNPRAILLMTDGMQNTPRTVSEVEGLLGGIDVHAIGFGTESNLNGPLLDALATAHSGLYTRAGSGLALEKFFTQAFGNIFETGVLMDPEADLPADQRLGEPQTFQVCGEETITAVAGWDDPAGTLLLEVRTPGGASITGITPGVTEATGRTWTFLRIPLPQGAERDGAWSVRVARPGGGEFPPPAPRLRYFINVVPSGGPRLVRVPIDRRYYTGDFLNPRVQLQYDDGSWPHHAEVRMTLSRPDDGVGNLLTRAGLRQPVTIDGDTVPARQATLAALEAETGKPVIGYTQTSFELGDDPSHTASFEPAGVFGVPMRDDLRVEGSYTFHYRATYGEGCTSTRELQWSLHVDVGVDPEHTEVTSTVTGTGPGGRATGTVTVVPRDRFGNHVGPGRGDDLGLTGAGTTTVTGSVTDNGDGSYTVPVTWDVTVDSDPGVLVAQPGRPPVLVRPPATGAGAGRCRKWQLLFWGALLLAMLLLVVLLSS